MLYSMKRFIKLQGYSLSYFKDDITAFNLNILVCCTHYSSNNV